MSDARKLSLPVLRDDDRRRTDGVDGTDGVGATDGAFATRLESLRDRLASWDERQSLAAFAVTAYERVLKTTVSLCSQCLKHVAAIVYSHQGRVLLRKRCEQHGLEDAVLENDERFYYLSNKDRWGRRFADDRLLEFPAYQNSCCSPGGCGTDDACGQASPAPVEDEPTNSPPTDRHATSDVGAIDWRAEITDQSRNKSCTVLIEVTNACNLNCRVCYSDAKGDRVLSVEQFRRYVNQLIAQKGELDSVQVTGGEAILHPGFWDILSFLHQNPGVRKIYLPTNGILFANPVHARRLAPLRDKLMLLLQFDGQSADANWDLRNANPLVARRRVIELMGELNIVMQLTMTLSQGVNDDEVGWVIDTGMRHSHIKLIALQPVTYSGRYELPSAATDRLTLSDVVKAVASQASRRVRSADFVPIPCSHPNCGWLTLFVRRWGLTLNVARHIDLAAVMNQVAYKTILSKGEVRDMVGTSRPSLWSRVIGGLGRRLVRPTDLFGIAVKPFMDRFNYDQDRVSNCCHHLLSTHGDPVSFCEYNARLRDHDSWNHLARLNNE